MTIVSNLDQMIKRLQNKLTVDLPQTVVKEVATAVYENTMTRIFTNGYNTNYRKIGKYSKSYKKLRAKKGLQTVFVDLTFSGYLKSIYKLRKKGDSYLIQFTEPYGTRIAGYMEQKFKCKIFALTDKDVTIANKIISNYVKKTNKK